MEWKPEPNHVQKLALSNTASTLIAAAACRSAAQIAHQHPGSIPDAAIDTAIEQYAALLKAAIGSLGERVRANDDDDD